MADTYPEDERRDVNDPEDRGVIPGVTEAVLDEDEKGNDADHKQGNRSKQQQHVSSACRAQRRHDVARDLSMSHRCRMAVVHHSRRMGANSHLYASPGSTTLAR